MPTVGITRGGVPPSGIKHHQPKSAEESRAILAAMPDAAAHLVPVSEIEAARERLGHRVHRTALMTSATAASWVSAATGVRLADDTLYLKPEHLQKTGSFKARGMINRIETLTDE